MSINSEGSPKLLDIYLLLLGGSQILCHLSDIHIFIQYCLFVDQLESIKSRGSPK